MNHQLHETQNKKILKLHRYLLKKNFKKVIEHGTKYLKDHPDLSFFYTVVANSHSQIGEVDKAFEVLEAAEEKFPRDYEVLFQMGKLYEMMSNYDNAIEYFFRSFNVTPDEYPEAKADCLNDIGALKDEQGKHDEAVKFWKEALVLYPKHHYAGKNLRNMGIGNEAVDDVMFFIDEFHEFESVQLQKYFEKKGKNNFDTKKEEKYFYKMNQAVWAAEIMPEAERVKKMDEDERNWWYYKIEIDYSKPLTKDL